MVGATKSISMLSFGPALRTDKTMTTKKFVLVEHPVLISVFRLLEAF